MACMRRLTAEQQAHPSPAEQQAHPSPARAHEVPPAPLLNARSTYCRPSMHAERMAKGAKDMMMPAVPKDKFTAAVAATGSA